MCKREPCPAEANWKAVLAYWLAHVEPPYTPVNWAFPCPCGQLCRRQFFSNPEELIMGVETGPWPNLNINRRRSPRLRRSSQRS
jgi:hypothetical protein